MSLTIKKKMGWFVLLYLTSLLIIGLAELIFHSFVSLLIKL